MARKSKNDPVAVDAYLATLPAAVMKDEISKTHRVSGATIHFSTDNPLPTRLAEKLFRARVRENAALREVRSQKRPGSRGREQHPTHQRFR